MALQSVHKDYTLAPRASGRLSWLETLLVTAAVELAVRYQAVTLARIALG